MAEIRWDLLNPVDTGAQVMQGFNTGMALVKHVQSNNALSSYLSSPDDPNAYNALAYYDPQGAASIERHREIQHKLAKEDQDEATMRAIGTQAAGGDVQGARRAALQSGNFDLAKQFSDLDEASRKRTAEFWQQAGPLAFKLRQTADPQARQALWTEARPMLEAQGADPAMLDKFDPTNDTQLEAAVTLSQKIGDLIDQGKITWHQQGEQPSFATDSMGRPVGTQNPYKQGQPANTGTSGQARGVRNNNPLNLTKSGFTEGQPGYAGTDSGGRYARFESPEAGLAAGQRLLNSYLERGFNTPAKIIERWAPASENGATSTANYISYVSRKAGLAPDEPVTPETLPALMQAMGEFENGGRSGGQRRVAAVGGAPHVGSKAEFDKLPSGTKFVAPDGSTRVKP